MSLHERIKEQLRDGQGMSIAGENTLCYSVGRKEAQQAFDAADLKCCDDKVAGQQAVIEAGELAKAELEVVEKPDLVPYIQPVDPENLTPEEVEFAAAYEAHVDKTRLFNVYARKLASLDTAILKARERKAEASKGAESLRAFHESAGVVSVLTASPTDVMVRDLKRFVNLEAGPKAAAECVGVLREYIEANPGATVVKIRDFEGCPVMICTASGELIVRVDFTVTAG